jgi:hypothetical protein
MMKKFKPIYFLACTLFLSGICFSASASELKLRISDDKNYIFIDITNIGENSISLNRRMPHLAGIGDLETTFSQGKKSYRMRGFNDVYWDENDLVEVMPMNSVGIVIHKNIAKNMFGLEKGCYVMKAQYVNRTSKPKKLSRAQDLAKVCFE